MLYGRREVPPMSEKRPYIPAAELLLPKEEAVRVPLPLYASPVSAGFPSPAEGYEEGRVDLNEYLIKNPPATFLLRVQGDSMRDAAILSGDIVVVDRSLMPVPGHIVVAAVAGEFTIKTYVQAQGRYVLRAANPDYPDIVLTEECEFFGVVVGVVRSLRKAP